MLTSVHAQARKKPTTYAEKVAEKKPKAKKPKKLNVKVKRPEELAKEGKK